MTAPVEHRTSSTRWPALDGFRGYIIWPAVSVHAGYLVANGLMSLTTFYVLSGFLITGLLLREHQRTGTIALGAFWARRARRLLPGMFIVVGAVVLYGAFTSDPLGLDQMRSDVISSVFYYTNWHFIASHQSYFAGFSTQSPVLHLWSLAVEEQFYFVWPLIAIGALWFFRGSARALGAVAAVGALASAVWMAVLYTPGGDPSRVYYGTDTRVQSMLLGAVLAVVVNQRGPVRSVVGRRVLTLAGLGAFTLLTVPWFVTTAMHDFLYGWTFGETLYSLLTVIVIWSLVQPNTGLLGSLLDRRPMRWFGEISYEMYLWNWPLYIVMDRNRTGLDGVQLFAFRLTLLVAIAAFTHFVICEPIRRGTFLRSATLARAAIAVAACLAILGATLVTDSAPPALAGDFGEQAGGVKATGQRAKPPSVKEAATATTGTGSEPLSVMVVGDSQAITLAQGVLQQAGIHGLSAQPGLVVWNQGVLGCTVERSDIILPTGPAKNGCGDRWWPAWRDDIASFKPNMILVWEGAWDVFDREVDGHVVKQTSPEFTQRYRDDMQRLMDVLKSGGSTIVVVYPQCFGVHSVTGVQAPERLDPKRIKVEQTVTSEVARANGAYLYDMRDQLCPSGENDEALRPDGTHVGNEGSDAIAPRLARYLVKLSARIAAGKSTVALLSKPARAVPGP